MPRPRSSSHLLQKRWALNGFGVLQIVQPSLEQLATIDERWPPQRPEADWNRSWRWHGLVAGKPEVFAVRNATTILGIWCSAKSKPIRLEGERYYRPDYLEVAPEARGNQMGVFTFLLIAARALELGATGIVLGTWPILRGFYGDLGGSERMPEGWNLARNLVPFVFDLETLREQKRLLDAKEHHGEATPNL